MKTRALILAAGEGTRMRSQLPKVFHKVAGIPILFRVLQTLAPLSQQIAVVLGRDFEQSATMLRSAYPETSVFHQNKRMGTGHAVSCALSFYKDFDGYVLVLPGDLPLLCAESLTSFLNLSKTENVDCAILGFEPENPFGYGRIVADNDAFSAIVEEKDASEEERNIRLVNGGVYIFRARHLVEFLPAIENNNAQKEYYLTDLPAILMKKGFDVRVITANDPDDFLGVNNREQLAFADTTALNRQKRNLMLSGVTILNPESVRIEDTVEIEPDTTVYGPAHIFGKTTIQTGCVLQPGAVIRNAIIGKNCEVKPYSIITESTIGSGCTIGPMAHLRPGTVLNAGVKVGNFVETKKAILHPGVKASHLSYLGDTEIGEETNIGAGTITCNYDGEKKHRTEIGKRVFIGSDSQLVAPLSIGDDAYVGAGSTITKDVPPCSLAISRARQTTIPDWAKKKKGKKCNQS
ncbi:MAG: UDP-N-acetylglucosamine diphosphorylase/glucosamine-1-phosphate N-acetyltransferase [Acidobacteria bacterium]|nr:UDP-N-acetylglucosamine diphosphorylase/glucosamine-1-phosphate N-acetyltransferase [Acidobacteriota bacterium]